MIDIDRIKERFISQVKQEFENPAISPFTHDWEKGVDLLLDLIKVPMADNVLYDAFLEALHNVLIEDPNNYNGLVSFVSYLEKYLGLIASREFTGKIDALTGNLTLMPLMRTLLRDGGSIPDKQRDKLYDIRNEPEFLAHLCRASCTRNDVSHFRKTQILPSWAGNDVEILQNRNSILVVLLYATLRHYAVLQRKWQEKRLGAQPDIRPYLTEIIHRYKEWTRCFVSIQGVERVELYASEMLSAEEPRSPRRHSVEVLRQEIPEKQFMLVGNAGTGKTTTLQYLALNDAEKCLQQPAHENIPIYLELRRFTGDRSLWQDIIAELPFRPDFTTELFEQGKINLFLDGLNEVDQHHRKRVIDDIQSLIVRYPEVRVVIAGREARWFRIKTEESTEKSTPVFEYGKMGRAQIDDFLAKNIEATDTQTRELMQQAVNNPIIEKLVSVPFMLFLMIQVVRRTQAIPSNIAVLMDEFMESLYEREYQKDANFSKDNFHSLMCALAFKIFTKFEANVAIQRGQVLAFLREKKEADGLQVDLSYILEEGIQLSILARYKNDYSFAHEEYLAYYAERNFE